MGQALYRKHRPKSLKEVVGQEHITETLGKAVKAGRISHAYLFTGPKGVGKTSIARILAHEINQLPYTDDTPHIDIIEIDAASNRRIDEIRELRDKVYVAPAIAKYKVYIIDEVHMLTREAFNALLKTLEEPPAHVVFILATTDAHKLPDTIISRTQRFTFKPVEKPKVIKHLKQIAESENIEVSDEALELLASHGQGSFRDSISLLDQAGNHGQKIEADEVNRLLGMPPEESMKNLLQAVLGNAGVPAVVEILDSLYDQGYQAGAIAGRLSGLLRRGLVQGTIAKESAVQLMEKLIEAPASYNSERFVEIALISFAGQSAPGHTEEASAAKQQEDKKAIPAKPKPQITERAQTTVKPKLKVDSAATAAARPKITLSENLWPSVLEAVKKRHNTLYGVVRMARPDFSEPGKLRLAFAFAFHQKRIDENSNRQKLADVILELTGQSLVIECLYDKLAEPFAIKDSTVQIMPNDGLTAISNIFGETELLES